MTTSTQTSFRYDGRVAVVTGAGSGLGRAYALFLAARGAAVVVNDLGVALDGQGGSAGAADGVVSEIRRQDGRAVANYDSVEEGGRIVQGALDSFGRIDIVVNNAGILRDVSLKKMREEDYEAIMRVHLWGAYKVTHAAWPHMRRQRYGRIVMTCSPAGLYGSFGQTNYSAAKLALVGFGETLAKEGRKHNVLTNIIAPLASSRMLATVVPPEMLAALSPEQIVPVVAYLVSDQTGENGGIFEVGGAHFSKVRWENSRGCQLRADDGLTPAVVAGKLDEIDDFSHGATHTQDVLDLAGAIQGSQAAPPNPKLAPLRFDGRVVVITGAANGLGEQYAYMFARAGAKVVVNDFADPSRVVNAIKTSGGQAVAQIGSAVDGAAVIKKAIDTWGRVDVVVNNAGILRDKSFSSMTDQLWADVFSIHMDATFRVTKAAWPYMLKQKYGRIINTTSTSGIYGNFGQSNYAAAKMAILGFTKSVALEGAKYDIMANAIAPTAGSQMTATVWPQEIVDIVKPVYIAPLVVALSHESSKRSGRCYEAAVGYFRATRFQRTQGVSFPPDRPVLVEALASRWQEVVEFHPSRVIYREGNAAFVDPIYTNVSRMRAAGRSSL